MLSLFKDHGPLGFVVSLQSFFRSQIEAATALPDSEAVAVNSVDIAIAKNRGEKVVDISLAFSK